MWSLVHLLSNYDLKVKKGKTMSFWTSLEADVTKGLEVASVVVGVFLPNEATLLQDIAESWLAIEQIFDKPTSQVAQATVSPVTQAAVTVSTLKQAAAAGVTVKTTPSSS
jgi:hypothetical protein